MLATLDAGWCDREWLLAQLAPSSRLLCLPRCSPSFFSSTVLVFHLKPSTGGLDTSLALMCTVQLLLPASIHLVVFRLQMKSFWTCRFGRIQSIRASRFRLLVTAWDFNRLLSYTARKVSNAREERV